MSQQSIATIQDVGNSVDLVLAERDLRVHARKADVTAIILTGTVRIEQDIIGLTDGLAPVGVFPDPLGKGILDQLLLALGDGGFLLVEDSGFPAIGIVHIIKNTDILQIQGVLDDLIGVDALGAVGPDGLDIAAIRAFTFNAPLTGDAGIVDLYAPLCAAGRPQRFKNKPAHIFGVQPCSAQPDGDLAGGEVGGLHLCECIGVDLILRVLLRLCLGNRPFLTHIARKVFVGGQILFVHALLIIGVQEHDTLEVRKQVFLVLAGEPAHVFHVHTGLFANGQRQRLHRRVYLFGGLVAADGALGEQVRLPFQVPVLVQNFQ